MWKTNWHVYLNITTTNYIKLNKIKHTIFALETNKRMLNLSARYFNINTYIDELYLLDCYYLFDKICVKTSSVCKAVVIFL